MNNSLQYVLEQIAAGTIDKQVGIQLVKRLREQEANSSPQKGEGDIAVIGMAVRLPFADHYNKFWNHIAEGMDCVRELPSRRKIVADRLTGGNTKYARAGYLNAIDEFDYPFFRMSLGEANLLDPNQRIFLQTAWSALEDAGYGGKKLAGTRTGIFIGHNAWPTYGTILSKLHPERMTLALPGNIASIIASRLNHLLDLTGPSMAIDTACSSSLVALHIACQSLLNGDCDSALAGGIKLSIVPSDKDFKIGIESEGNKTRAFDDQADGALWGEGAAVVLLKPLNKAVKDRDHIYAVIKGSSINNDGSSIGLTAPNAHAQEKLLVDAWERAGINPETISYIEAHGTGTRLGDPIEIDGITRAFQRFTTRKQFCGIGSVKTNIGHLDGASGIVSFIKTVMCLENRKLLPSLSFTRPNRNIRFEDSPLFVNDQLRDWVSGEGGVLRCGVSSFGFSGTNCHVVLEEAPQRTIATPDITNSEPILLVLSAKELPALMDYTQKSRDWLASTPEISFADLCYTANTGREAYRYRLALLAENRENMIRIMDGIINGTSPLEQGSADFAFGDETGERHLLGSAMQVQSLVEEWNHSGRSSLTLLRNIAAAFAEGWSLPWKSFYEGEVRWRRPFPTYPFRSYKCWMEIPDNAQYLLNQTSLIKETKRGDRKGLRDRQELEHILVTIWKEVLEIDEIAITDNFFELGGHSIMAVHMEAKLMNMGIVINAIDFQEYTTIQKLASYLADGITNT